ncbi:MAG: hypothetical protein K6T83_18010, partial [Alicyclobacillus sp.]|nr:hypothetical protein [Alicyclobacillus sp.]
YGLQLAPVSIGAVWTGTGPGYPDGSVVYASLTNVGTTPVTVSNVIGVLLFHRQGSSSAGLSDSDWEAFVNGPQHPLLPGDSTIWSFRPIGAPADAAGKLTEKPALQFYAARLVPQSQADVVWQWPPVKITNVTATARKHWATGQSVRVTAVLENTSKRPVPLRSLHAIVWFSKQPDEDFTQPDVIRFMNGLQRFDANRTVIAPSAKLKVHFDLIGPPQPDLLQEVPHVALVKAGA